MLLVSRKCVCVCLSFHRSSAELFLHFSSSEFLHFFFLSSVTGKTPGTSASLPL